MMRELETSLEVKNSHPLSPNHTSHEPNAHSLKKQSYVVGLTQTNPTEKTGIPRIREALEANDWAQLSDDLSDFGDFKDPSDLKNEDDDDDGKELDPESLDFGFDKADFEGLRASIWTSGMPQPDDDDENEPEKEKNQETKKQPEKEANGNESGTRAVNAGGEGQERPETETELDDGDVEKMESMMRRLVAVREAGEGMGYEQRRRMAARAVEDVMKEL